MAERILIKTEMGNLLGGSVRAWLPASNDDDDDDDDDALFRILYDDDDVNDLEEHQVVEAIQFRKDKDNERELFDEP